MPLISRLLFRKLLCFELIHKRYIIQILSVSSCQVFILNNIDVLTTDFDSLISYKFVLKLCQMYYNHDRFHTCVIKKRVFWHGNNLSFCKNFDGECDITLHVSEYYILWISTCYTWWTRHIHCSHFKKCIKKMYINFYYNANSMYH